MDKHDEEDVDDKEKDEEDNVDNDLVGGFNPSEKYPVKLDHFPK